MKGRELMDNKASREIWIRRWVGDLRQDARFAVRTVRKRPGFAAIAVLSAALGIGACSMIFGLANHALFRPLAVEDPSRVVTVLGKDLRRGKVGTSIAYPDFEDLRQAHALEGMTAFFQFMPAIISSNGEPQRYWGSVVTANYFDVVPARFVIGRGFDPLHDDIKGQSPVVVLGDRLWRSRFASNRGIVGQTIQLNGRRATVLGVTGSGFRGTDVMFFSDFWVPFSMLDNLAEVGIGDDRLRDRASQWLMAAGRLRDGVSERAAAAEVEGIGRRLSAAYPATNKDRAFHVERAGQVNPGFRQMVVVFFLILLVTAGLVLCTACANVANLLLARASARQQEIAIRLAIGAGRGRLIRQLLTESVMLALLGGIGGYALAQAGTSSISRSRVPLALPVDLSISLDYRVVLFCTALAAFTGVVFGLVPALRATRPDLVGALKDRRTRFGHSRRFGLTNLLVIAQVAMCMVLLIGSGLFLRSLYSASNIDVGFAHRNLLMMAFDPSLNRYSPTETRRIVDAIIEGAGAVAGVESVTLSNSVPLTMEGTQDSFVPADASAGDPKNPIRADIYSIAPRFFDTFGIRVIAGEDFRPGIPAEDIAIVNQALADKAFPKQSPIGRRIVYLGRVVRITGLVATTKSRTIGEDPHPCLYFPIARDLRGNASLTGMTLVLRTRGNPGGYAAPVRQTIRNIDPSLAIFDVRTMDTQLSQALFLPRTAAVLFGFAGFMGLLIATIGIYGVISFAVARQTKEIGIRMALGARRQQVLGMILRQGLLPAVIGSVIGIGLSLALARVTASLLYGVSSADPVTFVSVPLLLLLVAVVACLVPGRSAASLDPIRALRYE